jgi:hypothetical protein
MINQIARFWKLDDNEARHTVSAGLSVFEIGRRRHVSKHQRLVHGYDEHVYTGGS